MSIESTLTRDYEVKESEWVAIWEVVADPVRFAAKFNAAVPGACRSVTGEDIRQMAHCGLIGRHGFFTREDLETVRGILHYERLHDKTEQTPDNESTGDPAEPKPL